MSRWACGKFQPFRPQAGHYNLQRRGFAEVSILFGLCIRGRRGGGTMIRGLFRRRGRAVGGFRGAAGYERKSYYSKAGEDNFFHKHVCGLDMFLIMRG